MARRLAAKGRAEVKRQVWLVTLLLACGGSGNGGSETPDAAAAVEQAPAGPEAVTFAPELEVDLAAMTRLPGGVYVRDVRGGSGAAVDSTSMVTVEYRAWLPDGTLFEQRPSSDGFGESQFTLNENAPVPGLVEGMIGMRAGGVRRVVIPPELGYDLIGRPSGVPADAVLVFEIRLTRVS